jgi:hypothetical protein
MGCNKAAVRQGTASNVCAAGKKILTLIWQELSSKEFCIQL